MHDYHAWIKDWFGRHAPQVTLSPEDNFFTVGAIDSFGVIELIEDMERNFLVQFSQDDFQDQRFSSISGLAEMLKGKVAL